MLCVLAGVVVDVPCYVTLLWFRYKAGIVCVPVLRRSISVLGYLGIRCCVFARIVC